MDRDTPEEPIEGPKLNQQHVIDLQGKQYVTYNGLLDYAHQKGLQSLQTELVSHDHEKGIYIFKATAILHDGLRQTTFISHGDATKDNVSGMTKASFIRMADTRAKSRALRDALNVAAVTLEELPEEEQKEVRKAHSQKATPLGDLLQCADCQAQITTAEASYSKDFYQRFLCRPCQAKVRGR